MGKFKSGDRVVTNNGDSATVLDSTESILIRWDSGPVGIWSASHFELIARKFTVGQFVRITADDDTNGEVGIVYEDDGTDEHSDPYHVALYDDDASEEWYSADEMTPWLPKVGERVVEAGVEDDEGGTVLSIGNGRAKVLWDSYPHAQDWPVAELEPEDQYEDEGEDELQEGDSVVYSNPMFTGTCKATVTYTDGEAIGVAFSQGSPMRDGTYHRDFFTKAA